MIEDGNLFCDSCRKGIALFRPSTKVLVQFGSGIDQHYCEMCFRKIATGIEANSSAKSEPAYSTSPTPPCTDGG
jgi:hypothetical protein